MPPADCPWLRIRAATNDQLMTQVRSLDSGNAWAVGRLDLLRSNAGFPQGVATQLPAITWFSVSGHVDGGLRGVVRAEARDEEAAKDLREVVGGFLALARLQTGSRPEFQGLGFGRRLFTAARRDLTQSGLRSLVVWALSDNDPAVAFYRALGGRAIARSSERFGNRTLDKVAFAWQG